MRAPYFSIITICKDDLDGLQQTGASICAQDNPHDEAALYAAHTKPWHDYEWIVVNHKSDDDDENAEASSYLKTVGANYIIEKDDGLYDAMNKGLKRANGVYVIFMNAGDVFAHPHILARIQDKIDEPLPDLIYGDAIESAKSGSEYYKPARNQKTIKRGMFTHHQSMLYKRSVIEAHNLWLDTRYKIAADYDFTLRFLQKGAHGFYVGDVLTDSPICIFEQGGISQTSAIKGRIEEFKIRRQNKIPLYKCVIIFVRQTMTHALKRLCAPLYWMVHSYARK